MRDAPDVRFWRKVDRSGGPDACWPWTASCDDDGYGTLTIDGVHWKASRYAWTLANGPIPDGLFVLHRCDNPPCCNPSHLFTGTHTENMRDCAAKGRASRVNVLKTHCPHGHEYTVANTYIYRGNRFCRACNLVRTHEKRSKPAYTGPGKRTPVDPPSKEELDRLRDSNRRNLDQLVFGRPS